MDNLDKNYLRVQFRLKVHENNATEFQSFFENILQEAFPDFQKIRPYGNQGDRGNDGYIPNKGTYYQVYAPKNPNEKEAEAAHKLKIDFEKLKNSWDQITKIRTYYFVFNDKYGGITIEIEKALAELKVANPEIEFKLFSIKSLEDIFFNLKKESILSLGFDIDSRNALRVCREILAKMEVYLDRGNGRFVLDALHNCKNIIDDQNDEYLLADWEILECRALQVIERTGDAKLKYENICKRYPKNPNPFLYLAEIYLNIEEYDKNHELLREVRKIDNSNMLLRFEELLRDQRLGIKIDIANIDEQTFPPDPRLKSNFYRLYAAILQQEKDFTRAESFTERAIKLNPDRLTNYIAKLSLLENLFSTQAYDTDQLRKASKKLLSEIDAMLNKIEQWVQLSPRNQAIFNLAKFRLCLIQENIPELERLAKESFALLLQCYFDTLIDYLFSGLLMSIQLPQGDLDKLLIYLRSAEKNISNNLSNALLYQFNLKKTLFSDGRKFFEDIKKENILYFISALEKKDYDKVWHFIKDDLRFAVAMANSAKDFPELRKKIIEKLPDDGTIQKDKLMLLLNYEERNIDEAFDILRKLDLSELRYVECTIFLNIARKKEAWDFVIIVLEKLLQYEKEMQTGLQLKLELFDANLKLERLPKAIEIGENILSNSEELVLLNDQNKEGLFAHTILAKLKHGDYPQAMTLLEMYPDIPKTVEFKVGVAADVYLKNRDAGKAITSIIDGMKILKTPTPEQYAKLFGVLGEIDHLVDFSLTSIQRFEMESFVKFKDEERWYFIGDGNELDAIKISSTDERAAKFLDQKPGDKVIFDFKYRASSEHIIETILPLEKYIFAQTVRHFNQMVANGNLKSVEMIEVPNIGDTIDTKNIIALLEDTRKGRSDFFNFYCKENIPLAFLAISEGGLTNAIGQIQNEDKGFIRFSTGALAEMDMQKEVAKRIIMGERFYIDGTSALILSETGLLEEIYSHLPNLKVPQSVIAMLLKCKEKYRYIPGQEGYLQYSQGKLSYSKVSQDQRESLQKKFETSVKLLESKTNNISVISAASKKDCWTDQRVPAELCDACILAQKEATLILTEDYLYLQAYQILTEKKAPEYCSAFAVMRILYEQKKITFEKYLGFFAYLSSYRFRFLQLTSDDIYRAIFGDGEILTVKPEKIRWFNFPLTLSEAYGVSFASSFRVVATFLMRVLTEDAVLPEVVERIFVEILSEFPKDKDKKFLGELLLKVCVREIENIQSTIIIGVLTQMKIDRLSQITNVYNAANKLWTPTN